MRHARPFSQLKQLVAKPDHASCAHRLDFRYSAMDRMSRDPEAWRYLLEQ